MPGNTFGHAFRLTTWGESHGPAVGCTVDGCPAGLVLHAEDIQRELNRRRPGQGTMTTPRQESDLVEILSGVFENKTTGAPISMVVRNTDARSSAYEPIKNMYRPGHADFSWDMKYGFRDWRGGGRSSAREQIGRVAGGAIARLLLATIGVRIVAYTASLGDLKIQVIDEEEIERNPMRCPDPEIAKLMVERVEAARRDQDSLGGTVEVVAIGVPPGLGEPVFDKLNADLAKAMISIGAIKAVEFGEGSHVAMLRGSENNDAFIRREDGSIGTATNRHGGILGGISTGEDILVRLTAKPPSSISKQQQTVDNQGNETSIEVKGRHDPTVLPRLVPVAEAMMALVLADHLLRQRMARVDMLT